MLDIIKERSLYLVTGEEYSGGRNTLEVVEKAIEGGIDIVQMREKAMSREELLCLGKKLSVLCRDNGVLFIVNDDPHLALDTGADGVHLGQEDILEYPVEYARSVLGEGRIIGVSTHSVEEFRLAHGMDTDYLAFGPVFSTQTKDYTVGKRSIPDILDLSEKPVFFIGGINSENVNELLSIGARNIAMISHITGAGDIKRTVQNMRDVMQRSVFPDGMLHFRVNGKDLSAPGPMALADLVEFKGLEKERVVVEHNRQIIPGNKWKEVFISSGDVLEILSFVGGG